MQGSALQSMLLASAQIQTLSMDSQKVSSSSEPIRSDQDSNLLLNLLRNQMSVSNQGSQQLTEKALSRAEIQSQLRQISLLLSLLALQVVHLRRQLS